VDKPLFLFMSYRSPHAHEFDLRKNSHYQEHGWPELERRHAARITMLDEQVQRLLDKLEAMGELDNTLILFTSDNGPHGEKGRDPEQFASSGGLRGFKRDMYKGGQKTVSPAEFTDVFPTLCELTGVPVLDQLQGVSLVPVMKDPAVKVRKGATTLYKKYVENGSFGLLLQDRALPLC
jgi:arylsulfatase A-like enzyme